MPTFPLARGPVRDRVAHMSFLASRTRSSPDGVGKSVRRREDPRLITGAGCYTDDVNLPGQAYASMIRSPHAHARTHAQQRHERPKIDQYDDHYFIVFYALEEPSPGVVREVEISIFMSPNAIVTVHEGDFTARAAVEMALCDLKARALGVPVHSLLGGRVKDRITLNAWIGTVPPAQAAASPPERERASR